MEAAWTEALDHQGQRRPAIVLAAARIEAEAAGLDRLWRLLQRTLQLECGRPELEVRLKADSLAICRGRSSLVLTQVDGGLGAVAEGVEALVSFRPAALRGGRGGPHPRGPQPPAPTAGRRHRTGDRQHLPALPTLVLALPQLARLGPESRFVGHLSTHQTPAGWEGEVSGQCLAIDLDCLVRDYWPHKLTGSANVTIRRGRFLAGRLEEAEATFAAGPGIVGRTLLDAAAAQLQLSEAPPQTPGGELLSYDQLCLAVAMDASGLRIQGLCTQAEPGTILRAGRVRLLGEPQFQPQPLAALVPIPGAAVPVVRRA